MPYSRAAFSRASGLDATTVPRLQQLSAFGTTRKLDTTSAFLLLSQLRAPLRRNNLFFPSALPNGIASIQPVGSFADGLQERP